MFGSFFKRSTDANTFKITQNLLENFPGGAFIYKADETEEFLIVNTELLRMLGCSNREEFNQLTGNSFRGFVHPDDLERTQSSIREQITNSKLNLDFVEYRVKCKDGRVKRLRDYGHLIISESLGPVYYVFVVDDTNIQTLDENRENTDILTYAGMGMWHIILEEGKKPRFKANKTMKDLLGITGMDLSEEETYDAWYSRIVPEALPSVKQSVDEMLNGKKSENTYLWNHPILGNQYVRCGGTAYPLEGGRGYVVRGYHYNVTTDILRQKHQQEKYIQLSDKMKDLFEVLQSMSKVYNSMHYINLVDNSVVSYSSKPTIDEFVRDGNNAIKMMRNVMNALASDEYRSSILEITDLHTLSKRMKGKKSFYFDFTNIQDLWIRGTFTAIKYNDDGCPREVIFTTQIIDEEKRREAALMMQSNTDGLTFLLNRRCYESDLAFIALEELPENLVIVSFDVNGLKNTNDSKGHNAGDELLRGAAQCISNVFGSYGKVYRIGGDEFASIITADNERVKMLLADLETESMNWSGDQIEGVSISVGFASHKDYPDKTVKQLVKIADTLMYKNKELFYQSHGTNPGIQRFAFMAICRCYIKILKLNLSNDTYKVIKVLKSEVSDASPDLTSITDWVLFFANKFVHKDDIERFKDVMTKEYLSEYFLAGNQFFSIVYRRLATNGKYENALLEIIPAEDFSKDNVSVYLYVKNISNLTFNT